jgi:hypothetical protein
MKRTPSSGIKIFDAPRRFLRGFLLTCINDERNISFLRMNKHKIIMNNYSFVLIALFSIFLLPGCGAPAVESAQSGLQNHELTVQRPEREPDMMGMVSNMVGNQVTILLFNEEDMPFNRGVQSEGSGATPSNAQSQGSTLNPQAAFGGTTAPAGTGMGRGMGSGFRGVPPGGEGGTGTFDREAMLAAREEMLKELKSKSIGTETIMIPVGIPIIGGVRTGVESGAQNQISFSDIQKDSLITVWLNPEVQDKKVAEFVALMGGGMGGNRTINGGIGTQN